MFSILGYSSLASSNNSYSMFKAFNFLELIHSFVYREKEEIKQNDNEVNKDLEKSMEGEKVADKKNKATWLHYRARSIWVTIKHSKSENEASNMVEKTEFDLKITFMISDNKRTLEILKLYITETTCWWWKFENKFRRLTKT